MMEPENKPEEKKNTADQPAMEKVKEVGDKLEKGDIPGAVDKMEEVATESGEK